MAAEEEEEEVGETLGLLFCSTHTFVLTDKEEQKVQAHVKTTAFCSSRYSSFSSKSKKYERNHVARYEQVSSLSEASKY